MIKNHKKCLVFLIAVFVLGQNILCDDGDDAAKAAEAARQADAAKQAKLKEDQGKIDKQLSDMEEKLRKGQSVEDSDFDKLDKILPYAFRSVDQQRRVGNLTSARMQQKQPEVPKAPEAPKSEEKKEAAPVLVPALKPGMPQHTTSLPTLGQTFHAQQKAREEAEREAAEEKKQKTAQQVQQEAVPGGISHKDEWVQQHGTQQEKEELERRKAEAEAKKAEAEAREAQSKASAAHAKAIVADVQAEQELKKSKVQPRSLTPDEEKRRKKRRKKQVGIGSILATALLLGGGGGTTGGILGGSGSEDEGGGGGGGGKDGGKDGEDGRDDEEDQPDPDQLYNDPPTGDDDFTKKLYSVANTFATVKAKFKEAIQNGKYQNDTFEINLGPVSIGKKAENVAVKYTFEKGAGSIDLQLNVVGVEVFPKAIDGFAVKTSDLLSQIEDMESKTFAALLFKPTSGLIFLIKMGLLLNEDPTFKNDIDFANHVLLESVLLLCRLKWDADYKDLAMVSTLFAEFPSWISKYVISKKEKQGKMFEEIMEMYSEPPIQTSAIMEAVSSVRQVADYKSKVKATKDIVIPLINSKLTYSEKVLFAHSISRLTYDLGQKLPKVDTEKALTARINSLLPLLKSILKLSGNLDFEPKFLAEIQGCIDWVTKFKPGNVFNFPKPLSGASIEVVKLYSLDTIITTCLIHYNLLSSRKFKGDYEYLPTDFYLGRGETEDAMLAIWLRCLNDAFDAKKILLNTTEKVVEIKNFSGTTIINPGEIKESMITSKEKALNQTQIDFNKAKADLKANKKSAEARKNYRIMSEKLIDDAQKLIDARRTFVRQYAVYYPLKKSDGSMLTVAEFAKREFANIKKVGTCDDALFDQLADIFEQIIGLPHDRIW